MLSIYQTKFNVIYDLSNPRILSDLTQQKQTTPNHGVFIIITMVTKFQRIEMKMIKHKI